MRFDRDTIHEGIRDLDDIEKQLGQHIQKLAHILDAPEPRLGAQINHAVFMMGNRIGEFHAALAGLDRMLTGFRTSMHALPQPTTDTGDTLLRDFNVLTRRVSQARQMLNKWVIILPLVRAQAEFKAEPLFPEYAPSQITCSSATDEVFEILHNLFNPCEQDEAAKNSGAFADIPLPFSTFIAHLLAARRVCLARGEHPPLRFLDVGCGSGFKLLAARQMLEWADGLELDPGYVNLAQSLLEQSRIGGSEVIEGNAFDFNRYDRYDVIYMFRPIRDEDLMKKLELVIVEAALPGTVIIAPYRGFAARHQDLGCGHIDRGLFVAGLDDEAATQLREKAGHIGTAARRLTDPLPSIWEPILAVAFRKGFALPISNAIYNA